MLVLSRKVGEKIVLPEVDVTVTVLKVNGNKIRLGISAPAGITVHRREVWRRRSELVDWNANSNIDCCTR
jgi:carbon storage regulator